MKKTQRIELWNTICETRVSFIAIFLFVVLAVGLYTGIGWSGKALERTIHTEFNDYNMRDFEVAYPYGISEEEIAVLAQQEEISAAEGCRTTHAFFWLDGEKLQAKIVQLTQTVDCASQVEGSLPEQADEIAVEKHWAQVNGLTIGDRIVFEHDDDGTAHELSSLLARDVDKLNAREPTADGMKELLSDTFTVTALLENPAYMSRFPVCYGAAPDTSTPISCVMFVADAAFDEEAFDGYPSVLLRVDSLRSMMTTSEGYKQASHNEKETLRTLTAPMAEAKNQEVQQAAQDVLDEVRQELEDSQAELEDASRQIADGKQQIADGKVEIEENEKKLNDGEAELVTAKEQLSDAKKQLSKAEKQIEEGEKTLKKKQAEVDAAEKELNASEAELNKAKKTIEEGEAALSADKQKLAKAEAQLKASRKHLAEKEAEFAAGQKQLAAQEEALRPDEEDYAIKLVLLQESKKQLAEAEVQLKALRKQLAEKEAELSAGQQKLPEAEEKLRAGKEEYAAKLSQLKKPKQQLADGKADLKAARKKLESKKKQYKDSHTEYTEGQRKAEKTRTELDDGWKQLAESKDTLVEKEQELADARQRYDDAQVEHLKGEEQYEKLQNTVAGLRQYKASVLMRENNGSAAMSTVVVEMYDKLRFHMAALFLIVGILVCYCAVSRIVHQQTVLIGMKKAFGLHQWEITRGYLLYAGTAALAGSVVGLLLSRFGIEPMCIRAMRQNYLVASHQYYVSSAEAAAVSGIVIGLILLSAFIACERILRRSAVTLLTQADTRVTKPHFYEKTALWYRLPLLSKTILNNCVNDTRRVFSMLVGVAGCTSLVVCALSFNHAILGSFDRQYSRIQSFDTIVYSDTALPGSVEQLNRIAQEHEIPAAAVYTSIGGLRSPEGKNLNCYVFAAQQEDFAGLLNLYTLDGETQTVEDGVWVSCAYQQEYGTQVGDKITFQDTTGREHTFPVAGFCEFYLQRCQLMMTMETYNKYFDIEAKENALILNTEQAGKEQVGEWMEQTNACLFVQDFYQESKMSFDAVNSISIFVVAMYLVLSVVMALLILLNLLVMFVEEKKRELIILMINGYDLKAARRYIYSDTIFLTAIGILLGIVLGLVVGEATIHSMTSESSYFIRELYWPGCAIGAGCTAVLSFFMSCIAMRRIGDFKLSDLTRN